MKKPKKLAELKTAEEKLKAINLIHEKYKDSDIFYYAEYMKDALGQIFGEDYQYRITTGRRKNWDGEPDLSLEGWEEYKERERFDQQEQRYWRKKKSKKIINNMVKMEL